MELVRFFPPTETIFHASFPPSEPQFCLQTTPAFEWVIFIGKYFVVSFEAQEKMEMDRVQVRGSWFVEKGKDNTAEKNLVL